MEYLLALPTSLISTRSDNGNSVSDKIHMLSEFVPSGVISSWLVKKTGAAGVLDVQFSTVGWNEMVNSLSTTAVLEFQGWVRSTTYAATQGVYIVSCQGSHTVYIRNGNNTHVLNADVYSGGGVDNGLSNVANTAVTSVIQSRVISSVYLKVGLVGIVMPIRGVAKATCSCSIKSISAGSSPSTLNLNTRAKTTGEKVLGVDTVVTSNSGRYVDSATTSTTSTSASSTTNSFVSVVPHHLKYIPELLKWDYKLHSKTGYKSKSTALGLLLRYALT